MNTQSRMLQNQTNQLQHFSSMSNFKENLVLDRSSIHQHKFLLVNDSFSVQSKNVFSNEKPPDILEEACGGDTCSWKGQLERTRSWKVLSWKVWSWKVSLKLEMAKRSWKEPSDLEFKLILEITLTLSWKIS